MEGGSMDLDMENGTKWPTEQKVRNICPYLDRAVDTLKKLSEKVELSDNDQIFETSERMVYPGTELLDHPYPMIQCRKRLYLRQNKIEVSYGVLVILGMLWPFEDAVKKVIMYGLPLENVLEMDRKNLTDCVHNILKYLGNACDAPTGTVPEIPQLAMHQDIFYEALKFMIGHELSHYLNPYIKLDYRDIQKDIIRKDCLGLINELGRTKYKKYADRFMDEVSDDPDERGQFYDNMAAEVLADYEGYFYLWSPTEDGYKNAKHITGISMAFLALRLVEYFEAGLEKRAGKALSIPVRWREAFLICVLHERHNTQFGSITQYSDAEWYPYQIADALFTQAMSGTDLDARRDQGELVRADREQDIAGELAHCQELIEKLSKASPLEVDEIYMEIDRIFDAHSSNDQFLRAFPANMLAETLCSIGYAFYQLEYYDAAHHWWCRAAIYFSMSEHPERHLEADCYYYLGNICYNRGGYSQAVEWFTQALYVYRNYMDFSEEELLKPNLGLAMALSECGKQEPALSILEKMLPYAKEGYMVREIYRYLGIINDKMENCEAALDWFQRALAVTETLYGCDDIENSTFYNSMGIIYCNMEKYDASEKYLMRAYEIKKKHLEADDLSLAITLYSLGNLETRKGCYGKALEWFGQAMEIRQKKLDEDHPRIADTFRSMGIACYLDKDYERALMYYRRAYNIFKKTLGVEHEETQKSSGNIDLCLEKMAEEEMD